MLQKLLGIEPILRGDSWQEQPSRAAAGDLQAVLADFHRAEPCCAPRRNRLLIRKQPHFDIEVRQLAGDDRRKAMVVADGAAGGVNQGLAERDALSQKAAAAAESAAALQADESAQHR